jgi:glycosyltransferase involved in cell wall biosynthesis
MNIKSRKPMISVILPVYKGERFLDETLKSILNQTFKNFELIHNK